MYKVYLCWCHSLKYECVCFWKKKSFSKVKSDCEMQRRKEFYFELILAWKMPWPILVNYPLSNYGFSLNERKFRVNLFSIPPIHFWSTEQFVWSVCLLLTLDGETSPATSPAPNRAGLWELLQGRFGLQGLKGCGRWAAELSGERYIFDAVCARWGDGKRS